MFKILETRTEYLEATLGLDKCLEISKELIHECVTVPGCCCCMPLLYNRLMDSCKYVRKNTLLAAKVGCICILNLLLLPSLINSETETATQKLFNWRKSNSDNLLELLKMSAKASSELNESTGRSQHCTIHHTCNSIDMCKLGWLYEIDILHFTPVSIVTGWDVIH